MSSFVARRVEESYLDQLEKLVVKRLKSDPVGPSSSRLPSSSNSPSALNQFSIDMNDELNRLESLISDVQVR
jgi:hypothetical protein